LAWEESAWEVAASFTSRICAWMVLASFFNLENRETERE
jgi:hypothetical protein